MQNEIESLEFVHGVNFEFIDSLKNNGTKYLILFDDSCEEIWIEKPFLTLPPLGDIGVWSKSTLNTTFFTRANSEETLSYKTLTLFSSSLPVT